MDNLKMSFRGTKNPSILIPFGNITKETLRKGMAPQQLSCADSTTIPSGENTSNIQRNMIRTMNTEKIESDRMTSHIRNVVWMMEVSFNGMINISRNVRNVTSNTDIGLKSICEASSGTPSSPASSAHSNHPPTK